jgi:hypothetical protein
MIRWMDGEARSLVVLYSKDHSNQSWHRGIKKCSVVLMSKVFSTTIQGYSPEGCGFVAK